MKERRIGRMERRKEEVGKRMTGRNEYIISKKDGGKERSKSRKRWMIDEERKESIKKKKKRLARKMEIERKGRMMRKNIPWKLREKMNMI